MDRYRMQPSWWAEQVCRYADLFRHGRAVDEAFGKLLGVELLKHVLIVDELEDINL